MTGCGGPREPRNSAAMPPEGACIAACAAAGIVKPANVGSTSIGRFGAYWPRHSWSPGPKRPSHPSSKPSSRIAPQGGTRRWRNGSRPRHIGAARESQHKIVKFSVADAPFERAPGQHGDVFLGNVVDEKDGGPITVGFGRYAPRQTLDDMVVAGEAMVVTRGRLTVRSDNAEIPANPGEVVYLPLGAAVVITANEEGAELVYATYPHWKTA